MTGLTLTRRGRIVLHPLAGLALVGCWVLAHLLAQIGS